MYRRLTLFLFLLAMSFAAFAQNAIHHCLSTDGSPVFTDQPCASLDATPAATADETQAAPSPLPLTCPQSTQVLQQRVAEAFENRDANALAALMQWRGVHQRQGVADVTRLMALVRQPLAGIEILDDNPPGPWPWSGPSTPAADATHELIVQTGMSDTGMGDRTAFAIVDDGGCMWLAP